MDNRLTIAIKGKTVELEFNYGQTARLGGYLGVDTYDGTIAEVVKAASVLGQMAEGKKGGVPFTVLNALGYLALSAMVGEPELDKNDFVDVILKEPKEFARISEAWLASLPVLVEEKEKKTPNKAQRKKDQPTEALTK